MSGVLFTALLDHTLSHPFRGRSIDHPLLKGTIEVQSVCSAAIVLKKSVWESVGGLDEKLSLFFSDPDYCVRCREKGKRIISILKAYAFHFGNGSSWSRTAGREDQKSYYFSKDSTIQHIDLEKYVDLQFKHFTKNHEIKKSYVLINVSTIADLNSYLGPLIVDTEFTNRYEFLADSRDQAIVPLFKLLGYCIIQLRSPILYFCDHYYSLRENNYWKHLRKKKGDLVVDRHTNFIELDEITSRGL